MSEQSQHGYNLSEQGQVAIIDQQLQVETDASDFVMDFAPVREPLLNNINEFGMPEEGNFAKTLSTKTSTDQSMLSVDYPLKSRTMTNQTQDSTNEFAEPDQTIIIFDWDDTLNPTTSCRKSCGKPGQTNFGALKGDLALKLREHALEAKAVIEKARELADKVVIVTNGVEDWVQTSCIAYLPSLQSTLSQIEVFSARSEWMKKEGSEEASPANMKERTFEEVSKSFYSRYPNQSWKNIISIGDHTDEREALERLARKAPSRKKCRLKAIKLIKRPSIKELTRELELVRERLAEIVEHDDNLEMHLRRIMCQDDLSISNVEDIAPDVSLQQKFGFTTGEEVLWRKADEKIPIHTKGIVIGFTIDRVCVRFPSGEWMFEPLDLVSMSHISAVQSWEEHQIVEAARTIAFSSDEDPCIVEKGALGIVVEKVQNDSFAIVFRGFVRQQEDRPRVGDEVEVLPGVEMMWNGEECYKEGDRGVVCRDACAGTSEIVDSFSMGRFDVRWYRTGLTSSTSFDTWKSNFRLVLSLGTDPYFAGTNGFDVNRLLEDIEGEALQQNVAYASSSLTSISTINSYIQRRPGSSVKWKHVSELVKLTVGLMDSKCIKKVDANVDIKQHTKQQLPMDEVMDGLKRCRISIY